MGISDVGAEVGKSAPAQAVLIAWLPPVLLGMNAIAIAILPQIKDAAIARQLHQSVDLLNVNKYLFILVAAIALSAFMSLSRVFFYKLLEGELWPSWLRRWRIERAHIPHYRYVRTRQQAHRAELHVSNCRAEVERLQSEPSPNAADISTAEAALRTAITVKDRVDGELQAAELCRKLRGRPHAGPRGFGWIPRRSRPFLTPADWIHSDDPDWIPMYPEQEYQVMPTRVGNALRAMETYGFNTYGLDMQTFWYELYSLADSPLRDAIDDNERSADTFVCSIFVNIGFIVTALASAIWRSAIGRTSIELWTVFAVSTLFLTVVHRGLLGSIREWSASTQALVNNGRLILRQKYGLRAPKDIVEEREMWTSLTGFVAYNGEPHYAARLDRFR